MTFPFSPSFCWLVFFPVLVHCMLVSIRGIKEKITQILSNENISSLLPRILPKASCMPIYNFPEEVLMDKVTVLSYQVPYWRYFGWVTIPQDILCASGHTIFSCPNLFPQINSSSYPPPPEFISHYLIQGVRVRRPNPPSILGLFKLVHEIKAHLSS